MIGQDRTYHWTLAVVLLCGALAGLCGAGALAQEEPPPARPTETGADEAKSADAEAAKATPAQASPETFLPAMSVLVDGKSQAAGVLILVFEPAGGEATQVRVNVVPKTPAKKITEDLAKELTFATGDAYKVKQAGSKKVTVKARSKQVAPFSLRIEQQTVNGVSLRISKK